MMTIFKILRWSGLLVLSILLTASILYQENEPPPPPEDPPFILPFDTDPGPSTWFIVQWYGNTTTAYQQRRIWYGGGQGIHFGVDFAAPCGTPVHAIGDGYVLKVDASEHGAGPHNLVIMHDTDPDHQFASLYGHLLEKPSFALLTRIEQGALIGYTGDPEETCRGRPHLHLEVRGRSLFYGYNPVNFIDADWDSMALFGPRSGFQVDLDNPRQWQLPDDQPWVRFGNGLINDYENPLPPGW